MLPPDHLQRRALADEVHARPPEPLQTPSRVTYLALLVAAEDRGRELAHIASLCDLFSLPRPDGAAIQFSAQLGGVRFKWERHGEFSACTLIQPGLPEGDAFGEPATALLPPGWLAGLPGQTLVAAHGKVVRASPTPPEADVLAAHFGGHIVVGAEIAEGAGLAYTDFRIHGDGLSRFLMVDRHFTPDQAGRTLQRLFEIEAYRMMALLAFPIARAQLQRTVEVERALSALTGRIAADGDDEALLQELTRLAAEIEREITSSQFRFGACRAYHSLVATRIAELREQRLPGMQTIEEFMARRLNPAVDTCATAARRLHELSERVAQISGLLSTRVEIKRERQNQALLASMDRRARLQLRLQQTVEGLSLAAIVYYVAGLVGYMAKAGKAGGLHVEPDLLVGVAIPVVALAMALGLRRMRRKLHTDTGDGV